MPRWVLAGAEMGGNVTLLAVSLLAGALRRR